MRMTQTAINYAKAIFELNISEDDVAEAKDIFESAPELMEALTDPAVKASSKKAVIDRVFPKDVRNLIKLLCDNGSVGLFYEICEAFSELKNNESGTLKAELVYYTAPTPEQLEGIKAKLLRDYGKKHIILTLTEDRSLIGGFTLRVGDEEIDHSVKGHIQGLSQKLIRR